MFYNAHIQEVSVDNGPAVVFVEELGKKYVFFCGYFLSVQIIYCWLYGQGQNIWSYLYTTQRSPKNVGVSNLKVKTLTAVDIVPVFLGLVWLVIQF